MIKPDPKNLADAAFDLYEAAKKLEKLALVPEHFELVAKDKETEVIATDMINQFIRAIAKAEGFSIEPRSGLILPEDSL